MLMNASLRILALLLVLSACSPQPTATPSQEATPTQTAATPRLALPSATPTQVLPTMPVPGATAVDLLTATPLPPTPTELPSPTATPAEMPACTQAGQTWDSAVDGMTLLCVPAGEFLMGLDPAAVKNPQEAAQPQHRVYLDAFWIDQTEITNALYARCVEAGVCAPPRNNPGFGEAQSASLPVTGVSRQSAITYCQWAERELPSEAQWEKAARGSDGRLYPWGDQALDCSHANARRGSLGPSCGQDVLQPVGSYPDGASPYGALDMIGNAAEMVMDTFSEDYYARSPYRNPLNTEPSVSGVPEYVGRGGSWYSMPYTLTAFGRDRLRGGIDPTVGFRCLLPDAGGTLAPVITPPALVRDLYLASPAMQGEDVFALQARLADLGYAPGALDGIFGGMTDAAVRAFQRINGLAVDGWVGPKTWAALFSPDAKPFAYPVITFTEVRRFEVAGGGYLQALPGRVWVFASDGLQVIDTANGNSRQLSMPVVWPMFKGGGKVWVPSLGEDGMGVLIACAADGSSCAAPVDFSRKAGFELGDSVYHGVDDGGKLWLDISGRLVAMPYDLQEVSSRLNVTGGIYAMGYDGQNLWIADPNQLRVWQASNGALVREMPIRGVTLLAFDGSRMWALKANTDEILAIAPQSGEVMGIVQPCGSIQGMDIADGLLWVSCYQDNRVLGLQIAPLP